MKFKVGEARILIPDGEFHARVKNMEPKENFRRQNLVVNFEIVEGEFQGAVARAFFNLNYKSFSPSTKLYQWCSTAAGENFDAGSELDTDVLLNKVFLVEIKVKESKKSKMKFSNVVGLKKVIYEI